MSSTNGDMNPESRSLGDVKSFVMVISIGSGIPSNQAFAHGCTCHVIVEELCALHFR